MWNTLVINISCALTHYRRSWTMTLSLMNSGMLIVPKKLLIHSGTKERLTLSSHLTEDRTWTLIGSKLNPLQKQPFGTMQNSANSGSSGGVDSYPHGNQFMSFWIPIIRLLNMATNSYDSHINGFKDWANRNGHLSTSKLKPQHPK